MDRAARTHLIDLTYRSMPAGTVIRMQRQCEGGGLRLELYWPGAQRGAESVTAQASLQFAHALLEEYVRVSESERLALDRRVAHAISGYCRQHMAMLAAGRDLGAGAVWEVRPAA